MSLVQKSISFCGVRSFVNCFPMLGLNCVDHKLKRPTVLDLLVNNFCIHECIGGVWFVFLNNYFQFKQYFMHFNVLFYPHIFSQIFSNNNFQFLNTCTKRAHNIHTDLHSQL